MVSEMSLPPAAPDEVTGLAVFLDAQRQAVRNKLAGLSEDDARKRSTPSSLSLLAILKHLGYCERRWFHVGVAGRDIPGAWPVEDWDAEYQLADDETVESVTAFYDEIVAESRRIVDGLSPDTPCAHPDLAHWNVRWVMLHMIEEVARHAGHADIIREAVDGSTGA